MKKDINMKQFKVLTAATLVAASLCSNFSEARPTIEPEVVITPITVVGSNSFTAEVRDASQSGRPVIRSATVQSSDPHANANYDNLITTFAYFKDKLGYENYGPNKNSHVISNIYAYPVSPFDPFAAPDYSEVCIGAGWYNQEEQLIFGNACDSFHQHWGDDLDIVAHEFSHSIIQYTSGLSGGEAASLNESFSDIMMSMVTYYHKHNQQDVKKVWEFGEDITQNAVPSQRATTRLRELQNPGRSWDFTYDEPFGLQSEFRVGDDHYSRLTPTNSHANAGVPNLAFYLFTHGGQHPRVGTVPGSDPKPTVSNACQSSAGSQSACFDMAAKIFFKAYTEGLSSNAKFIDAKNATALKASQLHPGNPAIKTSHM